MTFSSKLDWGSYIISIAKNGSKKIGALICSMKFLLRLLCISIDLPYAHAYNTSCYLELLDKLQKWICRTVGPSLTTSRELLAHRRNAASLSLFYRYYFGIWHLYWLNRFHFFILEGGQLVMVIDWLIFLSPFHHFGHHFSLSLSFFFFLLQCSAQALTRSKGCYSF